MVFMNEYADYLQQPTNSDLGHIPGNDGMPILGRAIAFGSDPHKVCEEHYRLYGPVSRMKMGPERVLLALGPDNAQALHLDPDKNFSSEKGLERFKHLIGGSLIMKDFDQHRFQRRLMQTAFKTTAMRNYSAGINEVCARNIHSMAADGTIKFAPRVKQTLLEIAAQTFTGVNQQGRDGDQLTESFQRFIEAFDYLFPVYLPGFKYFKGLRAKREVDTFINQLIEIKRNNNDDDILAHFCREKDDNGNVFSNQDISENFVLLLFAAQDTTTASLVNAFYELGRHPQWQQRIREESLALGKENLDFDDLDKLPSAGLVFNEAQRLHASVPLFPRRSIRPCQLSGVDVPPNTMIMNAITYNHRMPEWWTEPLRFDPERFERGEHKQHPFLFHPFGGGAHKCIGMHFAQFVFKTFIHHALSKYRIEMPADYIADYQYMPMAAPKDGLPLKLVK